MGEPPAPRSDGQPTHDVRTLWDVRIPVRDGLELSANLWLPVQRDDRADERFPVILEMIPYGKDSWRLPADMARGTALASRGFALCRLDARGTGSSPGIAVDEYAEAETLDGYDAVEWLATQPWSNGNVGMWGISYGGFTAIQVAKMRPPHLRAIAPMYATDDRYRDDVHYRGGCLTVSELSQYAVSQVAMNAMPPDPAFRGDGWLGEWKDRLERTPPWLLTWLRQQADGPYWRQGSLAPDYGALECAVLHIGGWMDSYVDPVLRMQERCVGAQRRSIIGPWVHSWPDSAYPGPTFDWFRETVRFFDRWLRDADNDVMEQPGLTWFQREWTLPEAFPERLNGRWLAAETYPVAGVVSSALHFGRGDGPGGGHLGPPGSPPQDEQREDVLPHRATVGTAGPLSWGAGHPPNGLARDLRPDEARSLTYTSGPLDEPLEVIGFPEAVLHVSVSAPVATVAVRLADVAPDGTSALVSAGILNLTHRRSDTHPEPMVPGRVEEVRVPLRATGYRWLPGHRIRLSVATASWPVIWPSPEPGELRVHAGSATPSRLELPILRAEALAALPSPPAMPPGPSDIPPYGGHDEEEPPVWRIVEDALAGTVTVETFEGGTTHLPDGRRLYSSECLSMTASDAHPERAELRSEVLYRWQERDFTTEIGSTLHQTSTATTFEVDLTLEVSLDGAPLFSRRWRESIPRQLV